ncbi:MAG TPA: 2-C-methyl-D-erythritol 2,4-cyclodiphosphate synthase [Tepidisphaeraceae bacterium]|nr:2-C-methyl-D-erythritol 2,4-cyclodiphosphate synthase [Tepidisphaeraceae bacterium]
MSNHQPKHPFLVGHGYDIHRLQTGGKLVLGGVVVSEEMSPVSYSDGDVIIHAIVDAMLGAMGWGDIGEHYSDKDPKLKGADSLVFLREVFARVQKTGYCIVNTDITVLAEKPRLLPFKPRMVQHLRSVLGEQTIVNIKACTNEQCDAIGNGQAIAAHAVVLLAGGM